MSVTIGGRDAGADMSRTRIALGVCAGLVAGPAFAADVLVYEAAPPPSGSPVYAAQPMIAADVSLALGYFWWDDEIDRYDYDTGEVWGAGPDQSSRSAEGP